jgi:hypothetical protein
MLKQLRLKNFKRFRHLEIGEFSRVVFRLEDQKGGIAAIRYDRDSLQYSLDHDWEIR